MFCLFLQIERDSQLSQQERYIRYTNGKRFNGLFEFQINLLIVLILVKTRGKLNLLDGWHRKIISKRYV
ncbi:Phospholipid-transporting ATPase FetA [Dirofilaria immitis]